MESVKEFELNDLPFLSDSSVEDGQQIKLDFNSNNKEETESFLTILEDSEAENLTPILRTLQAKSIKGLRIQWVDEGDNPKPLHTEYSHPRWVISQRGAFRASFCTKIKWALSLFIMVALILVAVYFLVRMLLPMAAQPQHSGNVSVGRP